MTNEPEHDQWTRPDLRDFQAGHYYRDRHSDLIFRFMGTACVTELDGETVGIFQDPIDPELFMLATKKDYDAGDSFAPMEVDNEVIHIMRGLPANI